MNADYIIVGQGLCGTWLSYFLWRAGKSCIVIDSFNQTASSQVAAGLINPVTGRRHVRTWMIEELLPFAKTSYSELGAELKAKIIQDTAVLDFFPTPQMKIAFAERQNSGEAFLSSPTEERDYSHLLNYDLGYGIISPCFLVNVQLFLNLYREKIKKEDCLIEDCFDERNLEINDNGVTYGDVHAQRSIYCDGIQTANSRYFRNLPFAPNKGEALIAEIPDLPAGKIYKKGISIVPWKNGLWWIGSSHEWSFDNPHPGKIFLEKTLAQVNSFLKLPYRVLDHLASVRPATLERRPFAGFHPLYPRLGIFNGMGTKGCSLAPYFANEMALGTANPEVDVHRFKNLLSRNI